MICLTGCLASRTSQRIVQGKPQQARAHLDELVQAFGPEQVYFEVQRNGLAEQEQVNEAMQGFAAEMGRPLVATADVHYLRREDYHHHAALLCVQTKSTLAQPKMSFETNEFFLKSSRRWRPRSRTCRTRSPRRSRSPSAATSRSSSASS